MTIADVGTLTPTEKRALLQQLLEQKAEFPLSHGQHWMWFLQQLIPGSATYHFPSVLRISSAYDVDTIRRTVQTLVERHAILRTVFVERNGEVRQRVLTDAPLAFTVVDARHSDETTLSELVQTVIERPIDLSAAPAFTCTVFERSPHDAVLLFVWHHIVLDGWSLALFLEEFSTVHAAYIAGREAVLPPAASYSAFVDWQSRIVKLPAGEAHRSFWRQHASEIEPLEIPSDFPRALKRNSLGESLLFTLGEDITDRVRAMATSLETTPFVVLLACFQSMLACVSGRDRITVSFPSNGRTVNQFEHTVGLFINQLSCTATVDGSITFRDLIANTRASVLASLEHQDFHTSLILQEPGGASATSAEAMFVLQKSQGYQLELPRGTLTENKLLDEAGITTKGNLGGLRVSTFPIKDRAARFDIELQMVEAGGALVGWLQYDSERYREESARSFALCFERFVLAALSNVDSRVSDAELLDAKLRKRVIEEWNDTSRNWPQEGTVADLFEEAARRYPDAIAAICGTQELTYRELDEQSNQIAHWIKHAGGRPQQIVGLCIPRSNEMLAALLGILKAGCVYLPLDPSNPQERLTFMLRDSGAEFVVLSRETCTRFRGSPAQQLCLHCDASAIAAQPRSLVQRGPSPLLNVLYTSGSTGRPKGVLGTQKGAINRMRWMWETLPFASDEVGTQTTTLGFVDAVWEIFGPLLKGTPSVIITDDDVRDVNRLLNEIERTRATRITLVPSLLRVLLESEGTAARLRTLKYWSCSGEALEPSLSKLFHRTLPGSRLFNLYGCSEAAADSTCFEIVPEWNGVRVPIGRPIANTKTFILDKRSRPLPPNIVGELFIGGDGLAAGYLGRADLTAERFVANPLAPDELVYRTGDRARYRDDGSIEYFGRVDHQVKIRGNRVEIGEVEAVLRNNASVESAAIVATENADNECTLVAYVVLRGDSADTAGAAARMKGLRAFLATQLPTYMIPAHFVRLDTMPLTSSGKMNRKALPQFDPSQQTGEYHAPRSRTEHELASLWKDALNVPRIGIHDNFFDWGGHSITALQTASRASKHFQRALSVSLMFQYPTVAEFAAYLSQGPDLRPRHEVVTVVSEGTRPALFWIPGGAGSHGLAPLARFAELLGPDQPFHAVATWRAERISEIETVEARAKAYVAEIRKKQPNGPYSLAGFCLGGTVAFEVAQQLEAAGEKVEFLGLINSWFPAKSVSGAQWLELFAQRTLHHVKTALGSENVPVGKYLIQRYHSLQRVLRRQNEIAQLRQAAVHSETDEILHDDEVLRATIHLASEYVPRPFAGRLEIFLSDEADLAGVSDRVDPRLAWRRVAGQLNVSRVQGSHDAILNSPHVESFAASLRQALDRSNR